MARKPEEEARETIDALLDRAGWLVQDRQQASIIAGRGVAIREYPLKPGHGHADYLLYVEAQAVGVIEAKPAGTTLTGVERQSEKYGAGLPDGIPAPIRPLPFLYESTGVETRFTNQLDPEPRSRRLFSFHRPETLADWLGTGGSAAMPSTLMAAEPRAGYAKATLRARLRSLPPLADPRLWRAQAEAIRNLEQSLADDRPRALIQMATGSGKTVTAISSIYRLIKYGGAQRVVFLVDRANLGRQALKEFQQYVTPDDGRKFTELYNVQRLTSNKIDPVARVVITTIQRLYSMLQGEEEMAPELEEASQWGEAGGLAREPVPVAYNPDIPVETFDFIFTDECHRSIYNLWRQVLEYFDAYVIGLTATPSKQTFGFFNQNLVMEYNHEQAVADGVNVDYDVYRIKTQITEAGATVEAGLFVDKRDRLTRAVRWEQLDEDFSYGASALDRDVVAVDQIRTVIRTFRDRVCTEIFPGRTEVPKTLIYAKDDSHADDIVQVIREEFGRGNQFAEKITYRTGTVREMVKKRLEDGTEVEETVYRSGAGVSAEDLLQAFRNSYWPRIAVTVDMIATGTDIKPLEVVMFMRAVRSRNFFEQMKGRGVRIIGDTDFQQVNPNDENDRPVSKTHFVIVDAVGVTEQELQDSRPLERQPTVPFDRLLQTVAYGNVEPDVLSSVAARLARLDRRIGDGERRALEQASGGVSLKALASGIVGALDPDRQAELARTEAGLPQDAEPDEAQLRRARATLLREAAAPLAGNPAFRNLLLDVQRRAEQTIDTTSIDLLIDAGASEEAREKQRELVRSFEQFLADHRDEITALQVLYSRPYAQRLRPVQIKELAEALQRPPLSLDSERIWQAYAALEGSRVRGSSRRILTDVVALVRFALRQDEALVPFPETVETRYQDWLRRQEAQGRRFSEEQRWWLDAIKEAIASSFAIELESFDYAPFVQRGGAGRASHVFGAEFEPLLDELNRELVA